MTAPSRFVPVALMLAGSLALSACAKKAPKSLPPEPGAATSIDTGASTLGAAPGSQADFVAVTQGADTIYFDTDQYNIDGEDSAALQKQAQWLLRYPGKRATIEGHCDERGTREYNLALGDRRAYAVKEYLVSLGIDANRLQTKSYGKERPVCTESDEACWAQNRRGYSQVVSGGAGS